jgi:two-component system phosphate regulon sensor histidine kinase PhoR
MLGIVIAQFLWIEEALRVVRNEFSSSVRQSLDNTVERMERERNATILLRQFISPPNSGNISANIKAQNNIPQFRYRNRSHTPTKEVIIHKKDTVIKQGNSTFETHIQISEQIPEEEIIIFDGQGLDVVELEKQIIQQHDSLEAWLKIADKAQKDRQNLFRDKQKSAVKEWIEKEHEAVVNNITESIEDQMVEFQIHLEQENEHLRRVYGQIQQEIIGRHNPLEQRLNIDKVEEILMEELWRNGVKIPFEYGVSNLSTNQLTKYKSEDFKDSAEDEQYKVYTANLFPHDIFRNISPYRLMVHFPDETMYIIKSQGWMVALSGIFTLFIMLTFFITIRTILNQKKLSQIKTDFINNMTHEFKTPIATISLATDSIMTPAIMGKPDHMKNFLKIIKEENSRMNSHVERVLQMSMIEKKDFTVLKTSKDVHELILKAVDNMQLLVNETGGHISTSLKADLTVFMIDEIHFGNVIVNLLENALKYAKDKPEVKLSTDNTNNGIRIIVEDKGIGMSREQQNKIFEKFYRASGGNVHNVKGFGLGLSYVKAVVDAHHGSINVKSKLNVGTEFIIQLPFK